MRRPLPTKALPASRRATAGWTCPRCGHPAAVKVTQLVQARRDLWTHHVPVQSGRQVDAELKAWLAEAYATVGQGP